MIKYKRKIKEAQSGLKINFQCIIFLVDGTIRKVSLMWTANLSNKPKQNKNQRPL